ncbi:hypothetical protein AK812_SmicGene34870 [Symbiodinium microadriaticum]|uniref:Uncharacterized protein n=2 Tax=Symbiodinium TaxID=2949 RepID=A0A1Q9CMW8_SYMMI|nr:hypothetical protein AK812_SmicGene34870 [Symbiodinium microadriaticum]CAE7198752.1 unnamed protein product [Symbiodinium sp. KB8]CAE7861669.1 unnamed protein product [Symbiodinium microadriaticum]
MEEASDTSVGIGRLRALCCFGFGVAATSLLPWDGQSIIADLHFFTAESGTTLAPATTTTTTSGPICSSIRCGSWSRMPQAPPVPKEPPFYWKKHLVLIGDSRMRYQYASLAYFFTYDAFATGTNMAFLASVEQAQEGYNHWFNRTSQVLRHDMCNCFRAKPWRPTLAVEHHYYRNPEKMLAITYLQRFGTNIMQGHWKAEGTSLDQCNCPCGPNECNILQIPSRWNVTTIAELASLVVGFQPDFVVFHPGWEEITSWRQEDVVQLFTEIQEARPSAQMYFKTRLLTSRENPQTFLTTLNSLYADMYQKHRFAERGWHMYDVSNLTANWKVKDMKCSFMWDNFHYDLPSNNAFNKLLLRDLFGVDVQ